jgi:uncharacterized protein YebE (UPF0316 family)
MPIPWDVVLGAVFIFCMRVCDVTIGTIRLILLTRGQKYYAAALGFFEVMIFVVAISQVIRSENNVWNILGYCAGFAVGNIVGVTLEERIALGHSCLRIFTQDKGDEMADALRQADFGVTETFGQGRSGTVRILETAVRRKDTMRVYKVVSEIDPKAFVVMDECRSIFQGYLRKGK